MRAFHSTGSRSTLAVICAGESSTASGPLLLFSSPGGVNGRRIFSKYAPSASETAPMRILSQSSSVFGTMSTMPCLVRVVPTALKMLSATGSSMYFISSFTDTTGLTSPHSAASGGGAAARAPGGGGDGDREHPISVTAMHKTAPAHVVTARMTRTISTAAPISSGTLHDPRVPLRDRVPKLNR